MGKGEKNFFLYFITSTCQRTGKKKGLKTGRQTSDLRYQTSREILLVLQEVMKGRMIRCPFGLPE
jgi:hypothetical protein